MKSQLLKSLTVLGSLTLLSPSVRAEMGDSHTEATAYAGNYAELDTPTIPSQIECKVQNAEGLHDILTLKIDNIQECVSVTLSQGTYNCPRGDGYHACQKHQASVGTCGFGINKLDYEEKIYRVTQINLDAQLHNMPKDGNSTLIDLHAMFTEYNAGLFIQGLSVSGHKASFMPSHTKYPHCLKTRLGCPDENDLWGKQKPPQIVKFDLPEHFYGAKCEKTF